MTLGGSLGIVFASVVLAVVMLLALAPGHARADTTAVQVSDPDTTASYGDLLGSADSTLNDGSVWTDKTVTVLDDADFLVAYSALATSQSVTGQTQVPVDVVFVIDLSGSMSNENSNMGNGKSRIANTVDAVNASIDKLMALNEHTRIAVVGFSDTATTLLPLDHYTKNTSSSNNYLRLNRTSGSERTTTLSYDAINSSGERKHGSVGVSGGTNSQVGMYQGMNLLATASSTTVEVDGATLNRIPSIILLSDGAATFSSDSSSWWGPSNNNNHGPGNSSYAGNGMKLMMTASYMKQAIDRNYGGTGKANAATVYTIGMGVEDLTGDDRDLARASLNPSAYLDSNNNMSNAIRNAWDVYALGQSPSIAVSDKRNYTFNHPLSYDISSLEYVDTYYSADNASSVTNVFEDIVSDIELSHPSSPTKVTGDDPTTSGYITYVDSLGQYMELKDVRSIIYGGVEYATKSTQPVAGGTRYVFEGNVESAAYGAQPLSQILIDVISDTGGNQTLTVKIPASNVPLRVSTVKLNADGSVKSNTSNDTPPLQVLYTVGLRDNVFNADGIVDFSQIDNDYKAAHTGSDGLLSFYSNSYTADTSCGDATAAFVPAADNAFYFIQQDTPLTLNGQPATGKLDPGKTYAFDLTYYEGTQAKTETVSRLGSDLAGVVKTIDGKLYIESGTPRWTSLSAFNRSKTSNVTQTASLARCLTQESDATTGALVVMALGNNGRVSHVAPAELDVTKTVTADEGLTVSADTSFEFTLLLLDAKDDPLSGAYAAQVYDGDGVAVGPTFTLSNGGTFTLKDGETLKVTGLPDSATYTVTETARPGFTTTATSGEGTLAAGTVAAASFENHYSATPATLAGSDIPAQKVLDGRYWEDGDEFAFTLTPQTDGAPMPDSATRTVSAPTEQDGKTAVFDFGDITYEAPGTYVYTVTEDTTSEGLPGITYSQAVYSVTVTVTDNGAGVLAAEAVIEQTVADDGTTLPAPAAADEAVFTNTFSPTEVTSAPVGAKVYTDSSGPRPLTDDMFTFTVKPNDPSSGAVPGVTQKADGTLEFDETTFSVDSYGKTYSYLVTEDIPDEATNASFEGVTYASATAEQRAEAGWSYQGVTYDSSTWTISVSITVGEDGALVATWSYSKSGDAADSSAGVVFENSYKVEPVTGVPANFNLTKVLEGKDWDGDEFTFTLTPQTDGAPMPTGTTKTVSDPTEPDGKTAVFDFGDITYDAPGTYVYTVTEDAGNNAGIEYSSNVAIITVTVSDNGDGTLSATAVVAGGAFTNTYATGEVAYDAAGGLQIIKTMTGRRIDADDFTFTMAAGDAASTAVLGAGSKTFSTAGAELTGNTATEAVPALMGKTFTKDDVGTYAYTVTENSGGQTIDGVTYDGTAYTVEIVVEDAGNGVLSVTTKVNGVVKAVYASNESGDAHPVSLAFSNNYEAAPISVTIVATKTLSNRPQAAGEFSFSVIDAKGGVVSTGTNDAQGAVSLSAMSYTTEKLNADAAAGVATREAMAAGDVYTYAYTVSEDVTSLPDGVSAVRGSFSVTVKVTDDGSGALSASVTYPDGSENGLLFINTYGDDATAEVSLAGNKILSVTSGNNAPDITSAYTFTLTGSEGAPMPAKTTATNDASGTVDFGSIEFTMQNVFGIQDGGVALDAGDAVDVLQSEQRSATFTYVVSESGSVTGVTNDPATSRTITVTVTDNGDGTISVQKSSAPGSTTGMDFTFTNTYSVNPKDSSLTGDGGFTISKTLDGRDLGAGEFTFDLIDDSGAVVAQASNDASGSVSLPALTYSKPEVYTYTLVEAPGTAGGVIYDGTVYTARATVTDGGDGTLDVAWSVLLDGEEIASPVTFKNAYTAAPTSIAFNAAKVLSGRALSADEFTFELRESGQIIQTATNDAEGGIHFQTIAYHEVGEYDYEISEVIGSAEGVTYDETVYTVHVSVTDEGKGQLKVTWSYGETGDPVFRNAYKAPSPSPSPTPVPPAPKPAPRVPATGDKTDLTSPIVVAVIGIALVSAGIMIVHRQKSSR